MIRKTDGDVLPRTQGLNHHQFLSAQSVFIIILLLTQCAPYSIVYFGCQAIISLIILFFLPKRHCLGPSTFR
jgi:hypothetical protein